MAGLKIFDMELGNNRDATQADLDGLQARSNAYGRLRSYVTQIQVDLLDELAEIRRGRSVLNEQPDDPHAENDPVTGDL
jgi:hypothetical protein